MLKAVRAWMLGTPLPVVVAAVVLVSVMASVGALVLLNWLMGIGFGPSFRRSLIVATVAPTLVAGPIGGLIVHLLREVEAARQEALALAWNDPLTGLLNRRRFVELAEREIELAQRSGARVSVALIDLDDFKAVNDHHGHAAGDAVLCAVAAATRGALRGTDLCGRWGGEEFAVLLPASPGVDAALVVERVQAALRAVQVPQAPGVTCSASIGIAERQPGEPFDSLVQRADRAMYRAKQDGKCCVRVDGGPPVGLSAPG